MTLFYLIGLLSAGYVLNEIRLLNAIAFIGYKYKKCK